MTTDFRSLGKILSKLEDVSRQIIKSALEIMEILQNNDNHLVDYVLDEFDDPPKTEDILEVLRDFSMKWVRDARIILDEIPNFIIEEDGVYVVDTESGSCQFLTEVWTGDYYDQVGNDGLNELLKDLNLQLQEINEDSLVEKTVDELKN